MTKIGVISDTHHYLHPKIFEFFIDCDELWHAGDMGSIEVADKLSAFKPLKAVYGNIDAQDVRQTYPEFNSFEVEDIKVLMTHIGGYPGKYNPTARKKIETLKPGIFVAGHSHILKVIYDKKHELLYINPGAAGKQGLHKKITMIRFHIDGKDIKNLEIFEADR